MPFEKKLFFQQYLRVALSFLLTLWLCRVFEYITIASKSFIAHAYGFELAGLLYDTWIWLAWCLVLFVPVLLLYRLKRAVGITVFHILNIIFLICYLALLITFSERTTPFDHEFFTRNSADSIQTVKQMMTKGVAVYIPFVIYIAVYYLSYRFIKRVNFSRNTLLGFGFLSIPALVFIKFINPSPDWFEQHFAWYLVSNKMTYWAQDSYHYFDLKNRNGNGRMNDKELEKQVLFYQQHQPFDFTSHEYPLLHSNNDSDVLGGFFNLKETAPNIVILVVEGLSRDFSGDRAYAGSFTPFLDSLSAHSLVWDNFLSTAPGTFAAHPAISGSLPYGKRGFSIMNIMPDHLSLIKILKANGYFTNFMIGFNPDFDNMGGYIRAQGTDFMLTAYGPKYKQMGEGKEGWSMGYPDDALFERSFEVLDSIKRSPYLSIYHTATTHLPYLFEQKPQYDRLFDKKLSSINVSSSIKSTLRDTKDVLVTYMFADDCIKKFFHDYSKRPGFDNTIFFITGDHHIGSFPSTCEIDDYHVPFIVWSPMLKAPRKFLSVNSHNNITPTILAMLFKNYDLPERPGEVHWLGGVMDTCTTFRNVQSMPFMSWSREINDYLYKDYFLSHDELYQLTPDLLQKRIKNDSVKNHITALLDNFKLINSYVCDSNKIYPGNTDKLKERKQLLLAFTDSSSRNIFRNAADTALMPYFKIPPGFKYLYVELSADVNLPSTNEEEYPVIRFAIIGREPNKFNYLTWSKREVQTLSKTDFIPKQWNTLSANDMFPLEEFRNVKDPIFEVALYTDVTPINLQMKRLQVRIYGIK